MLNDQERRDLAAALNPYSLAPAYSSWQNPTTATLNWQPVMDILQGADGPITLDAVSVIEALISTSDMALLVGQGFPDHAEKVAHLVTAAVLRGIAFAIAEGIA